MLNSLIEGLLAIIFLYFLVPFIGVVGLAWLCYNIDERISSKNKEAKNRKKQTRIKDIIDNTMILNICDTSALMTNRNTEMTNRNTEMTNRNTDINPYLYINEEYFKMNISYHIPTQVVVELHNHFKDSEKEKKARSGRKKINILKRDFAAQEVDLSSIQPYKSSSVIGSDSLVDRQIIGYALKMLESEFQFVVISTEDGGIQYDIIELRKSGYKIYSSDEEKQLKSAIRLYVEKELGQGK